MTEVQDKVLQTYPEGENVQLMSVFGRAGRVQVHKGSVKK